mgnify:CR=1 FL=1
MVLEIIGQEPINIAELKAEIEKIKKRDNELGFRAQKTLDYLQQFSRFDKEKAKELYQKLEKLNIQRLKDKHFHKIIDTMPADPKDVKVVLQGYNVTLTNEVCKKIADLVAEYV